MTKPSVDKKFIVQLQGKDFVTYEGLLDLAHQKGLQGIKTEIVQFPTTENNNQCIFKAIAYTEKGQFEGYGDADNSNVNSMIKRHLIRMAETRAKARALRDLTNVGMTAVEEMGGDEEHKQSYKQQGQAKTSEDLQAIKDNSLASEKQLQHIYSLAKKKNYTAESMSSFIKNSFNKNKSEELTSKEASELIKMLQETKK